MIRRIPNLRQIKAEYNDQHGVFEYGPLAPGYAITLGTALRRVLLSSIPGCGIYAIKIDGVLHQYSTIAGMREDVIHFIQNLKLVTFQFEKEAQILESTKVVLEVSGPAEITADMIDCPTNVVKVREPRYLCYLNPGASLKCEIFLRQGEGYVETSRTNVIKDQPGLIMIDNVLNSVKRVSLDIDENVQHREYTDYEVLRISVDTDGSINPSRAIDIATSILITQFNKMTSMQIQIKPDLSSEVNEVASTTMIQSLDEFGLPPGTVAALKEKNINTLEDLLNCTKKFLFEIPKVGLRKINDIETMLSSLGLNLKDEPEISVKRSKNDDLITKKSGIFNKGDH